MSQSGQLLVELLHVGRRVHAVGQDVVWGYVGTIRLCIGCFVMFDATACRRSSISFRQSKNGIAIAVFVDLHMQQHVSGRISESAQNATSALQQDLCLSLNLEYER